jgi:hypothetical protein
MAEEWTGRLGHDGWSAWRRAANAGKGTLALRGEQRSGRAQIALMCRTKCCTTPGQLASCHESLTRHKLPVALSVTAFHVLLIIPRFINT